MKYSRLDWIKIVMVLAFVVWALLYIAFNKPSTQPVILSVSGITILAIAVRVAKPEIEHATPKAYNAAEWICAMRSNTVRMKGMGSAAPLCIPVRHPQNLVNRPSSVEIKWIEEEPLPGKLSQQFWASQLVAAAVTYDFTIPRKRHRM